MNIERMIKILKKINNDQKYTILACTLDRKGKLISMKTNDYKCSHPLQKYFAERVGKPEAIYLHAEISALIASKNKPIHTVLIARIDSNGMPVLAAPCPICQEAMKAYGVKEIVHT